MSSFTLFITAPYRDTSAYDAAFEKIGIRPKRFLFWEQVDNISQDLNGTDRWFIDGNGLLPASRVIFLDFPVFASKTGSPSLLDQFAAAEWQASLTAMLWSKRCCVLNGEWLVGKPWLQRNPYMFLPELWGLGWSGPPQHLDGKPTSDCWALFEKWEYQTYPVGGVLIAPDSDGEQRIRKTFLFMKQRKIDYLLLKFLIGIDEISLIGTSLLPSHGQYQLPIDRIVANFCREYD